MRTNAPLSELRGHVFCALLLRLSTSLESPFVDFFQFSFLRDKLPAQCRYDGLFRQKGRFCE